MADVLTSAAYFAQLVMGALQVGILYGLLAAAYVLIHAITRRFNFAFGSFSIIAGYSVINVTVWLTFLWPGATIAPLALAFLVAVLHTALAGLALERLVAKPLLRAASLAALVATLGVAIAMEELVRLANDSRERWMAPIWIEPVQLGAGAHAIHTTPTALLVLFAGLIAAAGLIGLVRFHAFGRVWRASSQDLVMAELCGVDVARTLRTSYILAGATAGAAGALLAVSYGVASFHGGLLIGLKTLFVAVVGGLASVPGAFAGGLMLALFEALWSGYGPVIYRDVAALAALVALLIGFPGGLFGSSEGDRGADH